MLNHDYIGTEHILLGLSHLSDSGAGKALEAFETSLDALRVKVLEILTEGEQVAPSHIPWSPRAKRVLELAVREALQLAYTYVSTEHILLGLVREGEGLAAQVLTSAGVDLVHLREAVARLRPLEAAVIADGSDYAGSVLLDKFGRDLTQAARDGALRMVVGRESELTHVMEVLSRRARTTPVLIGEPGVGKSAVLAALAEAIVGDDVPESLRGKTVYQVSFDLLDGMSEASTKDLATQVRELLSKRDDIILCVDGVEGLVTLDKASPAGQLAQVLRSLVIGGTAQLVGETTVHQFRKHLQTDAQIAKMVQAIPVGEPDVPLTVEILKGLRDTYEAHHRVSITTDALKTAAVLADRYVNDRCLPGKAIDLLDEAGARRAVEMLQPPQRIVDLDDRIRETREVKEEALDRQDFEQAARLRDQEKQLTVEREQHAAAWRVADMRPVMQIGAKEVQEVIARRKGLRDHDLENLLGEVGTDSKPSEVWAPSAMSLLGDSATSSAEMDLLRSAELAAGVASLIIASRTSAPLVIGVDAGWGMGKSTLLKLIDVQLAANTDITRAWYNAWTSRGEGALEGVIKTVLGELDSNVVRKSLRRFSNAKRTAMLTRILVGIAARFVGLNRLIDNVWEELSINAKSRNEIHGLIEGMLTDWIANGADAGGGRVLVVFVDDLDRCPDDSVVEICEAIKLYLDVPGLMFILACDQSVIAQRTSRVLGANPETGRAYLEKIVQVSYRLPAPNDEQVQALIEGYARQAGTSEFLDRTARQFLVEHTGRNPRRIKRIINSIVIEGRMSPEWSRAPLSPRQLVAAVLLQHLRPDFYEYLVAEDSGDDPITDFLQYVELRERSLQPPLPDNAWWVGVERLSDRFGMSGIERSQESTEHLQRLISALEKEFPSSFSELARNRSLRSLLEQIGGRREYQALRRQLRTRPLSAEPVEPPLVS